MEIWLLLPINRKIYIQKEIELCKFINKTHPYVPAFNVLFVVFGHQSSGKR